MNRKLYLIRHSYAEPPGSKDDFDRKLTHEGQTVVRALGRELLNQSFKANKIYCSSAVRTRETATNLLEELGMNGHVVDYLDVIYNASVRELLAVVNEAEKAYKEIAIIGHNPAITYFGEYLTGEGIGNMEPSSIVTIRFIKQDWSAVSQGTGEFVSYYHPST
ncbi:MAG: histidine phosphatase family protein [Ekhidna sp.]